MKNPEPKKTLLNAPGIFGGNYFILALMFVFALAATFAAAIADFVFQTKALIVAFIALFNLLIWFGLYFRQKQQIIGFGEEKQVAASKSGGDSGVDEKLLALEEASEFFGAALKSEDMFRLISSRINEIIPFDSIAFFLLAENSTNLKIAATAGENAKSLANLKIPSHKGLAGKTFVSQKPQHDEKLLFDKNILPVSALENLNSAVAVPLWKNADVFGVLELFGKDEKQFGQNSLELLEAAAERVTPLFLSSLAFEESLSNALTDVLTNLPNERAFFLVLENQIAESQRFRDERLLTVLTVDIKNFNELNEKIGHAAGDRVLLFTAEMIKKQLRQMDFLARSINDEFMAILPTASSEIAQEIVERIKKAFELKPLETPEKENIFLELNFGLAAFWQDGETAQKLLQTARLVKQQTKLEQKNKVLRFPKEFVN